MTKADTESKAEAKSKEPKFGTPVALDPGGAVPRVVDPLSRAPNGFQRFKVVCRNYTPRPVKYVLAKAGDEKSAKDCYLKATGLDAELKRLADAGVKDAEPPMLAVTALPD